jgi:hypothetical protein
MIAIPSSEQILITENEKLKREIDAFKRVYEASERLLKYLDEDIGMDKPELTDVRFNIHQYQKEFGGK